MIINGKAYDWADVDIDLPGLNLDLQEISYDDELEKEVVYGAGNRPKGYGTGNYKSEGKMTMLRDDYDDLLDYCKRSGKPFFDLVIPKIVVSYANDGAKSRSDVLNTVTLTKRSNKAAQGDKSMTVDVDFIIVNGIVTDGVNPV